jgi:CRISPR/Cas system CMR-associated protein Cmr1 (group 7 of RAMP superfamily)
VLNASDKIGFTNLQKTFINSNEAPQSCQTRIAQHGAPWSYTLVKNQTSGANSH